MKAFIHMDISMRHISTGDIKMASKFDCEQNKKQEAEEWQSSAIRIVSVHRQDFSLNWPLTPISFSQHYFMFCFKKDNWYLMLKCNY